MSLMVEKWEILFNKYNIQNEIKKNGLFFSNKIVGKKINKPIRLVYMVYSNGVFRLLEYEFILFD